MARESAFMISQLKNISFKFSKISYGLERYHSFHSTRPLWFDVTDIKNKIYNKYRFFRIWFFLQRHKDFAFKPFFTNFNTIERIENYL